MCQSITLSVSSFFAMPSTIILGLFCLSIPSLCQVSLRSIPACMDLLVQNGIQENQKLPKYGTSYSLPTLHVRKQSTSNATPNSEENVSVIFQLAKNIELKCSPKETEYLTMPWNGHTLPENNYTSRNFNNRETGHNDTHLFPYFTKSGHLYDNKTRIYHKPDGDYCVKRYLNFALNYLFVFLRCYNSIY